MGVQVDKEGAHLEEQKVRAEKISQWQGIVTKLLRELKGELRQVTWTAKDELAKLTKIVVSATFAFGLGIYGVDLLIKNFLIVFQQFVHWIFG